MIWTTVPFGKHQGKTLPQIVIDDPDWFFWILPRLYGQLKIEADDLARKASKIKIPRKHPCKWLVEFRFAHGGRFRGFGIVRADSFMNPKWSIRLPYHDDALLSFFDVMVGIQSMFQTKPDFRARVATLKKTDEADNAFKPLTSWKSD
jgi:hypothetical protein